MGNRIWIELDKPRDLNHARKQCELANNMLKRLGVEENRFFHNRDYYCYGSATGYIELKDRGHWLNLDFLGRVD